MFLNGLIKIFKNTCGRVVILCSLIQTSSINVFLETLEIGVILCSLFWPTLFLKHAWRDEGSTCSQNHNHVFISQSLADLLRNPFHGLLNWVDCQLVQIQVIQTTWTVPKSNFYTFLKDFILSGQFFILFLSISILFHQKVLKTLRKV